MMSKLDLGKEIFNIQSFNNTLNENIITKNLTIVNNSSFKQYPSYIGDINIQPDNNNLVTKDYVTKYIADNITDKVYWLEPVNSFVNFEFFPDIPQIGDRYISEVDFDDFIQNHIYEYVSENNVDGWKDTQETKDCAIVYCISYNGIDHGKVQNMLIYLESDSSWQ